MPLSLSFPPGTARVLSGAPKPSLLQVEPAPPHRTVLQTYQTSDLLNTLCFVVVSPLWSPKKDIMPGRGPMGPEPRGSPPSSVKIHLICPVELTN